MNGLLSSRPTTTSPLHRVALVCALLSLVALSLFVAPASGQASRTWISGVGDDTNPCSRTAPCKTWTGAQSKTATNGEIDITDPGDFGTTTITKAMVLDGLGLYAGILTNITGNAVVIDASNTSVVVLRNMDLYGHGTGTYGVSILGGKAVIIENLNINGFIGAGIHIANDATVTIIHSRISFCPTGVSTDATSKAKVSMDDISIQLCTDGVEAAADTSFSITNSAINQNSGHGVVAHPGSHVTVAGVVLASNAVGLRAENGTTVIIHDSDFYSNTIASIECTGDPLTVYSDNRISDTLSNICVPTTPPPPVASSASRKEVAALSFLLL